MKKIIVVLMLLCISGLWAEKQSEPHNLGFLAGQLCRNGVGYRHWGDIWGYQLSGMLFAGQDNEPDYYDYHEGDYYGWGRTLKANIGISAMKTLKKNGSNRFYVLFGYGFYHKEKKLWESNYPNMNYAIVEGYEVTNRHYLGTGVGIDFEFMDYFRGFVEIPITFQSNGEITMYIPQVGILYKF